eukprot:scaffold8603_cov109-Isochrysis_galbana.AAC.8
MSRAPPAPVEERPAPETGCEPRDPRPPESKIEHVHLLTPPPPFPPFPLLNPGPSAEPLWMRIAPAPPQHPRQKMEPLPWPKVEPFPWPKMEPFPWLKMEPFPWPKMEPFPWPKMEPFPWPMPPPPAPCQKWMAHGPPQPPALPPPPQVMTAPPECRLAPTLPPPPSLNLQRRGSPGSLSLSHVCRRRRRGPRLRLYSFRLFHQSPGLRRSPDPRRGLHPYLSLGSISGMRAPRRASISVPIGPTGQALLWHPAPRMDPAVENRRRHACTHRPHHGGRGILSRDQFSPGKLHIAFRGRRQRPAPARRCID